MWTPSTHSAIRQETLLAKKRSETKESEYPFYVALIALGDQPKRVGFADEKNAKEYLDHVCEDHLPGKTRFLTQKEAVNLDQNALFGIEEIATKNAAILCKYKDINN